MNVSYIILGAVMICIGLLVVIIQIKSFKKGLKDEWGYQKSLLMTGFAFIVGGIIALVKSF